MTRSFVKVSLYFTQVTLSASALFGAPFGHAQLTPHPEVESARENLRDFTQMAFTLLDPRKAAMDDNYRADALRWLVQSLGAYGIRSGSHSSEMPGAPFLSQNEALEWYWGQFLLMHSARQTSRLEMNAFYRLGVAFFTDEFRDHDLLLARARVAFAICRRKDLLKVWVARLTDETSVRALLGINPVMARRLLPGLQELHVLSDLHWLEVVIRPHEGSDEIVATAFYYGRSNSVLNKVEIKVDQDQMQSYYVVTKPVDDMPRIAAHLAALAERSEESSSLSAECLELLEEPGRRSAVR